jgi:DNA-binding HxlR family transcriptional regulator
MKKTGLSALTCSVARTVELVGDTWNLMVVRELFLGSKRFDDIATQIGISPHLLSVRLRKLTEAGVLTREAYQQRPLRYQYRLSAKGRDLWPVIVTLKNWGDRWLDWPEGPPLALRHKGCGHASTPTLVCSECGEPVDALAMHAEPGETMLTERAVFKAAGGAA